ncbi:MAG TPA: SIMPL domain-containing protein [Candidatus Nanoarchaeia archaeon]|nr:SIMPL domain-containing protein [Candidatus Nanoarchaeia archaeon]
MKQIIVFSLIVALLLGGCIVTNGGDKPTISSSGTAQLSVLPDEAQIFVAVETLAKTADESKTENAQKTDAVYAALYKINIPRDSIETQYFNIYEEFDWSNNMQKSKGFKTQHTLKIKTAEFDDVGKIIDAVVGAGATRIDSISFDISNAKRNELKKQVLAEASKDAREKAEAIASGLNAELGDIISVSDLSYDYTPYPYLRAPLAADAAVKEIAVDTQISPQKLEVTAQVQVSFEVD